MNRKKKILYDFFLGGGSPYSAEAEAVFTNIGGTLTTDVKDAIATFVDAEVAAGRWEKLEVFQLYGTSLGSAAQGLKNWISSSYTATNPHGHTALIDGYDIPGSGSCGIDTNYNANAGTKWTLTDFEVGIYVKRNDDTSTDQLILLGGPSVDWWVQRPGLNRLDFFAIQGIPVRQAPYTGGAWDQALWTSEAEFVSGSSYAQRPRRNGVSLGLGSAAVPTTKPSTDFFVGGANIAVRPFNGVLTLFFAGGKFNDTTAFYNNLVTLFTSLGVL